MTNSPTEFQDRFHVVLVEPADSLNIGAVARAMMNLGFRHLHLVAPPHFERQYAGMTARRAFPILDALHWHDTFADAVADMEEVVGLALPEGIPPANLVALPQWSAGLPTRPPRRTALVFGPEDNGLREEHLNLCRWIVRIPSSDQFSAFNLAQSVLLTLYEITRTLELAPPPAAPPRELPTANDLAQLDRHLNAVMVRSGFLRPGSPRPVPGTLQTLLRRMELDRRETAILLALFARIHKTLLRGEGRLREEVEERGGK